MQLIRPLLPRTHSPRPAAMQLVSYNSLSYTGRLVSAHLGIIEGEEGRLRRALPGSCTGGKKQARCVTGRQKIVFSATIEMMVWAMPMGRGEKS